MSVILCFFIGFLHGFAEKSGGISSHSGDMGRNNVIITSDVMHHSEDGIYVGENNKTPMPIAQGYNLDDLHDNIAKNRLEMLQADQGEKEAEMEQARIEKELQAAIKKKKEAELKYLENLDERLVINQEKSPEALGKPIIYTVKFTTESIPLKHHIRSLKRKLYDIQKAENKLIESQEKIARLDDVTDEIPPHNPIQSNPEFYKDFLDAASLDAPKHFPVFGTSGSFYLSKDKGKSHQQANNSHSGLNIPENKSAFGDHSHRINHDRV